MKYATVDKKTDWKPGQFVGHDGQSYRTRQIYLVSDDGKQLHVNVKSNNSTSMKFNKLNVGDKICDFKMLKMHPTIISPDSDFRIYSENALF